MLFFVGELGFVDRGITEYAGSKEPAWHRNRRHHRQRARGVLAAHKCGIRTNLSTLAAAARRLDRHHGSSSGGQMATSQRKPDWLCKSCKGVDGKPFRTFGSKAECWKCKIQKGHCFLRNVEASAPSRSSFAEKQLQKEASEKRQTKLKEQQNVKRELQQQEQKHKKEVEELRRQLQLKQQSESSCEEASNVPSTLEEASRFSKHEWEHRRKMYDELGETAGAMHCIEQIKVLANAELAATPGHVQLRRAEAEAATCRKQLAALQVKKEDLAKKMGEVELCLANAQAARQTAEQRVEEVKRRIVQPSVGVSQSSAPLGSKAQAELAKALPEILPADFLGELGIDAEQWAFLRAATGNGLVEKAMAKAAEAAKAEAESIVAQAKASAVIAAAAVQSSSAVASVQLAPADNQPPPQHYFEEDDVFMQLLADDDEELAEAARRIEEAAKRRRTAV